MGETKSAPKNNKSHPRRRRLLLALAAVALLVVLVLVLLPIGVRIAAENYLEGTGLQATIGDVDINLFTGRLAVSDASAHTAAGDSFDIGHAAINIDYLPLLSREIHLTRLTVRNSSVDVRRARTDHLRVGGFTVLPWDKTSEDTAQETGAGGPTWSFGVEHISLDGVTIHYLQAGAGDLPELERRITFNTSSARDVNTWQQETPAQVDAEFAIGESNSSVRGRFTAFGEVIGGQFTITTSNFMLDIVAPLARNFQITQLEGRLDSDLTVTASYSADHGLDVTIDGHAQWQQPRVATTGGFMAAGEDWVWDGRAAAQLFRPGGGPGRVTTDAMVALASIEVRVNDTFDAHQNDVRWQGRTALTLTAAPRARVEGALSAAAGEVTFPGADMHISNRQLDWQGTAAFQSKSGAATPEPIPSDRKLSLTGRLGLDPLQPGSLARGVTTDGTLSLASVDVRIGDTFETHLHNLRWQGQTSLTLAPALEAQAEGTLSADAGQLSTATVDISSEQPGWQGTVAYRANGAIHSLGRLETDALEIALGDSELTVAADAAEFNGRFVLAGRDGAGILPLSLSGDLDTTELRLVDNAIGRYLARSDRATATDFVLDTVADIRMQSLDVEALRAFERSAGAPRVDDNPAVFGAARAQATNLSLQDLAHLAIGDLSLSGAAAILARTGDEGTEIGAFFGSDEAQESDDDFHIRIAHTTIGNGSMLRFVDTTIEPSARVQFSQIRLEVDDLNTDGSAEPADYRLSTDIGSNGQFASQGALQLFGASGPDGSLTASVDSLYLPPFSGYLKATLGRAIARGNMDADLDLTIDDGELNGLLHVILYNFALGEGYSEQFQNALGISLDEAIALVRDAGGRIEFSTRILGNVTEPWFSTANLFRQALYAGLKSAIFSFYSPLGWVEAAGDFIADLASRLDLKPVIFKAGEAELSAEAKTYLSDLAGSMEARPEPQIEVCGYAVPDDADARTLFGFGEVDADSRADLEALAAKRRRVVVDYLASQGLDKGRLAPCPPQIDRENGARPRVTLAF